MISNTRYKVTIQAIHTTTLPESNYEREESVTLYEQRFAALRISKIVAELNGSYTAESASHSEDSK